MILCQKSSKSLDMQSATSYDVMLLLSVSISSFITLFIKSNLLRSQWCFITDHITLATNCLLPQKWNMLRPSSAFTYSSAVVSGSNWWTSSSRQVSSSSKSANGSSLSWSCCRAPVFLKQLIIVWGFTSSHSFLIHLMAVNTFTVFTMEDAVRSVPSIWANVCFNRSRQ